MQFQDVYAKITQLTGNSTVYPEDIDVLAEIVPHFVDTTDTVAKWEYELVNNRREDLDADNQRLQEKVTDLEALVAHYRDKERERADSDVERITAEVNGDVDKVTRYYANGRKIPGCKALRTDYGISLPAALRIWNTLANGVSCTDHAWSV